MYTVMYKCIKTSETCLQHVSVTRRAPAVPRALRPPEQLSSRGGGRSRAASVLLTAGAAARCDGRQIMHHCCTAHTAENLRELRNVHSQLANVWWSHILSWMGQGTLHGAIVSSPRERERSLFGSVEVEWME